MRAIHIQSPSDLVYARNTDANTELDAGMLIKVAAAGLNRADILQRQGKYPPPPGVGNDILGMEVSGEIVGLGTNVKRWKRGDRVCALLSSGGYAEYAVAPETQCLPVPKNLCRHDRSRGFARSDCHGLG